MNSAYRKLDRARHHQTQLSNSIDEYRALDPINFRNEHADHAFLPDTIVFKFYAVVEPAMPDWWGLAFGDILTNLRAALDHALFDHVRSRNATLSEADERGLVFPVIREDARWEGTAKKPGPARTLRKHCDPDFLERIRLVQPYARSGQSPVEHHALAMLARLVNLDKHREVSVVAYETHELTVDETRPNKVEIIKMTPGTDPLVDGALASIITVKRPQFRGPNIRAFKMDPPPMLGFVESIEIPGVDRIPGIGVRQVAEHLVNGVASVLDDLKT